jgi:MSHA biogenesis protein MshL
MRLLLLPLFSLALAFSVRADEVPTATPPASAGAEAPQTFSFRAENLPVKQALALFARANNLNIVPDLDVEGSVTVDFRDLPLDLAMSALLDANGFYAVQDGRLLRVKKTETRVFQIDYIHVTRAGEGSNAVKISSGAANGQGGSGSGGGGSSSSSSGAGGQNEGSTMTVTNTSTVNFWGDLGEQLKSMVSPTGSFTVNSLAGTVLVRDNHRNIEMIADYLSQVTKSVVRQLDLEVEIYEIALGNSSQLGVNWNLVSNRLNTNFSTLPGQGALPAAGGLIVQNPLYGPSPGAPALKITSSSTDLQTVIDALKQQGTLKIVSKPRLRTLNNQPAVVRVGQDLPVFLTQSVVSPGTTNQLVTTTESIQTITVGTVLSITPQIAGSGLITLDITPAVSRLVRIDTSATGNTKAPIIDIRQASSIVRLRDGATVIMGGLVQDSNSSTTRKVPFLGDIPLLGKAFTSKYQSAERTELIFFVTPRIVREDEESAKNGVKTAAN